MVNIHRKAIESLYLDKCTISRLGKTEDPDTRETIQGYNTIYENQPCRISQKSLAVNTQTEAENKIMYETKLFISPEIEIKQGDRLIVSRNNLSRKYTAGEPFIYSSHQEVSIQRKEWA
ncbi:DUF6093 family protein [Anaerophilus nitritogenes]|uniref:DUF6093 family protein n=1 Tax=Anaerophilus nitritogenes TaxID=2498136 RepID=UPI00101CD58B|nr:DUF6093 family protein [Anaerophilus nitritogenes]